MGALGRLSQSLLASGPGREPQSVRPTPPRPLHRPCVQRRRVSSQQGPGWGGTGRAQHLLRRERAGTRRNAGNSGKLGARNRGPQDCEEALCRGSAPPSSLAVGKRWRKSQTSGPGWLCLSWAMCPCLSFSTCQMSGSTGPSSQPCGPCNAPERAFRLFGSLVSPWCLEQCRVIQ